MNQQMKLFEIARMIIEASEKLLETGKDPKLDAIALRLSEEAYDIIRRFDEIRNGKI